MNDLIELGSATIDGNQVAPPQAVVAVESIPTPATDAPVYAPEVSSVLESFRGSAGPMVRSETLTAASAWLSEIQRGDIGKPAPAHAYNTKEFAHSFTEVDQPLLVHFLNRMATIGASQTEVSSALSWYLREHSPKVTKQQQPEVSAREIEEMDRQDAKEARAAMMEEWGNEASTNFQLVQQYLQTLPADEREEIEQGITHDGRLKLNDPQTLRELARKARGASAMLIDTANGGNERQAIEAMMRDRTSAYYRGPQSVAIQARYRDLIRAGDTGERPLPQNTSAINREIAEIEQAMRTDRRAYVRDEVKQKRYRELLAKRG